MPTRETRKTLPSVVVGTWTRSLSAICAAVGVALAAPAARAQCSNCSATNEPTSCAATQAWDFCCVPGFVLADDNADGSAAITMSVMPGALQIDQTFTSDGCCVAPYANIGIFDACQGSDQYGQAGSHLPIQLGQIEQLQGAWTFQVPYPLNPDWTVEQYRVYFEMFLSSTTAGHTDAGNITINFFWSNYGWDATPTGHAQINGPQGMDYYDHGTSGSQGPFVDFLYPQGTFTPDSNGVVTVTATDVEAVLDWAVANFPSYYNNDVYLSSLSLAEEAGAFHGNVHTSYASFAVQKTGSAVVYTPSWTSDHWTGTATDAGTGTPDANTGTSDDAGVSVADSGSDASARSDAGAHGHDAGATTTDSGTSSGGMDGGSHEMTVADASSGTEDSTRGATMGGCAVTNRGPRRGDAIWFGVALGMLLALRRRRVGT